MSDTTDELVKVARAIKKASAPLTPLNERRRELIIAADAEGLSLREVAAMADVAHQTVANILARQSASKS